MYNLLNYLVILMVKGPFWLLVCLCSLCVCVNTWPAIICQVFWGKFSRTDFKSSLKIKCVNAPRSKRNRSIFLPHILLPKGNSLPKSTTSPLLIFITQESGAHGATPGYLLAVMIDNCSNCNVEVGADCHDSLTWGENSTYIM